MCGQFQIKFGTQAIHFNALNHCSLVFTESGGDDSDDSDIIILPDEPPEAEEEDDYNNR